jgi:hypothetical protein
MIIHLILFKIKTIVVKPEVLTSLPKPTTALGNEPVSPQPMFPRFVLMLKYHLFGLPSSHFPKGISLQSVTSIEVACPGHCSLFILTVLHD